MKELPDLKQITDSDKDALIQTLWDQLQKLQEKKPKKTSKHSSLPPAQGFKAAVSEPAGTQEIQRSASVGRSGGGRKLSEPPDPIIRAEVKNCKTCGASLSGTLQQLMQRYEKVEIPPIRPVVTQVERYGCSCPGCGELQLAPVAVGLEPGSPFGDGVAALAPTLRYQYRCRIYRDLDPALALFPTQADGMRLQKQYRNLREHLFLFLEDTTIPPTNHASERGEYG